MGKNVVIIESQGKIKSYKKALGEEYNVIASMGHCVDLPAKGLSINLKKNFEPTFGINPDKTQIIAALRTAVKKASKVYLMSDSDREGEAIAWHLKNILESSTKATFYRASTNEVTKSGILKAIKNPGEINMQIIDAYLCRRLLDRLCGYKTSFLTKQATGGRSAGRVQSAMLRIIADREKEIIDFIPEEYWVLTAKFKNSKSQLYTGVLDEKIKVPNQKIATQIYNDVTKGNPIITSVEKKEIPTNPYAPFTTSTLIQSASTFLGWPAPKTMKMAQELYEAGYCTYMRTDSPSMAKEAVEGIRSFIDHSYGNPYLHPTVRYYKAKKGAQEGHECCRPTEISTINTPCSADANKLYTMIWKRAIASQMTASRDDRTKVITQVSNYDFISRGNIRLFDGFKKVWNYSHSEDSLLPELSKGEKVSLDELEKEQKWTTPPNRYSDASLQKKCDTLQVTRPATFASFLKTLESRGYIIRTKKSFQATELGMRVIKFLVSAKMCFVNLKFTAELETMLDEVSVGKHDKNNLLHNFWETLKGDIEEGKKIRDQFQKSIYVCPKCKGSLMLKHSYFGPFFSCENYKKDDGCSYIAKVGKQGEPVEKVVVEKEYAAFKCESCGDKMVKRKSKFGEFWGCADYPKCKRIADLEGVFQDIKKGGKKKWAKKKTKAKKNPKKK